MPASQTQRILLTDKAVKGVPFAPAKPQIIRDTRIAGFHLWVGKSTKTYRFQYEAPRIQRQAGLDDGGVARRAPPCHRRRGTGQSARDRGPAGAASSPPQGGACHRRQRR